MKNTKLLRLKDIAKLEALIIQGANYDKILKQSQKIGKYIIEEMLLINKKDKDASRHLREE